MLDPIDGTKGFLRGGQYAIHLALIVDVRLELGVIGCPNLPFNPKRRPIQWYLQNRCEASL
jgi:3'(2'), 5'-bisphosphate nucleotidase